MFIALELFVGVDKHSGKHHGRNEQHESASDQVTHSWLFPICIKIMSYAVEGSIATKRHKKHKRTRAGKFFCAFCAFLCDFCVGYGSPSPFLPFFLAGSASRGRVAGGGGASTFGVGTSGFGCAFGWSSSAFGGGGIVTCSSLGSVCRPARHFRLQSSQLRRRIQHAQPPALSDAAGKALSCLPAYPEPSEILPWACL